MRFREFLAKSGIIFLMISLVMKPTTFFHNTVVLIGNFIYLKVSSHPLVAYVLTGIVMVVHVPEEFMKRWISKTYNINL